MVSGDNTIDPMKMFSIFGGDHQDSYSFDIPKFHIIEVWCRQWYVEVLLGCGIDFGVSLSYHCWVCGVTIWVWHQHLDILSVVV